MPDVRLPDGRIIRGVPDGTTQEDLMEMIGGQSQAAPPRDELQAAPRKSMADEVGRQIGLTGRVAASGIMAIPNIFGDAANAAINLGVGGFNKLTGANVPKLRMPSQVTDETLNEVFGAPRTSLERIVGTGAEALVGAGGAGMAARAGKTLMTLADELPSILMKTISRSPVPLSSAQKSAAAQSYVDATRVSGGLMSEVATAPRIQAMIDKLPASVRGYADGAANAVNTLRANPRAILDELASAPIAQAAAGLTGATAVEAAKNMTDNPLALGMIGVVGGMAPGAATKAAGGAAREIARPFTGSGQELAVGRTLNSLSLNPEAAAFRMEREGEIIPGSAPMVSQVSGDPGLIGAESALRGMDQRGFIPARESEQNAARMQAFDNLAQDEAALDAAKRFRDSTFKEIAEPAFANAKPIQIGMDVQTNPVLAKIAEIRGGKSGKNDAVAAAMNYAEQKLRALSPAELADAETLYQSVRKNLQLVRDGKLSGRGKDGSELGNIKNAKSQINDVIDALDSVIESGAPGYRDYMRIYAERSIPLDQLKSLQALRQKAVYAVTDPIAKPGDAAGVTRTPIIRNTFSQLLQKNLKAGLRLAEKGPKAGNLNETQLGQLGRIAEDIDRGAAASAATMRVKGSDTFKNMTLASVIGRTLGDTTGKLMTETAAGKAVVAPFAFLYRMPEQEVQLLMLQAWTDPKLAARLMRHASEAGATALANELAKRAAAQTTASSLYVNE